MLDDSEYQRAGADRGGEQPETTHAEVVQNPETIVQTAEETESKYKVFDGMSEDWGSDDLEGFVLYKLPEQYADKGYAVYKGVEFKIYDASPMFTDDRKYQLKCRAGA